MPLHIQLNQQCFGGWNMWLACTYYYVDIYRIAGDQSFIVYDCRTCYFIFETYSKCQATYITLIGVFFLFRSKHVVWKSIILFCHPWGFVYWGSGQLVPKTTRAQDNSYPGQLVPKSSHTHDNSYPRQLVPRTTRPKTTRTQDNSQPNQLVPWSPCVQANSYPWQFVPRATRIPDNSYPRQFLPRACRIQDNW